MNEKAEKMKSTCLIIQIMPVSLKRTLKNYSACFIGEIVKLRLLLDFVLSGYQALSFLLSSRGLKIAVQID